MKIRLQLTQIGMEKLLWLLKNSRSEDDPLPSTKKGKRVSEKRNAESDQQSPICLGMVDTLSIPDSAGRGQEGSESSGGGKEDV